MKKIYLILSVLAIVFTSCENDFDVNAEWKETMVVFGLLDKSQDIQFIKINKAFLGEADAYDMASVSDSFNYNPEDIIVSLHTLNNSDTIFTETLKDTIVEKDDGLFALDNNVVYYLETPAELDPNNNYQYALTVENIKTGNVVSANTELIRSFFFTQGIPNNGKINFLSNTGTGYWDRTFRWELFDPNVAILQFTLRFHYTEDGIDKNISWSQPTLDATIQQVTLVADDFFNKFLMQLGETDAVRKVGEIYIEMTLGSRDLENYILVNEPITGIVQQRPQFTNVQNGIGLFSSRYSFRSEALELTTESEMYIIEELDLNFQ